ncbi:hypothetical protein PBY51_002705 [Eleginops maclovinus]|uniref:Uncharacterized protein n=1 Tax=Eleginops maclovinus TaxID=56733 RepID=A0AAN7XE76_ELEMC|nr:hypothetical protein PBY51_002705 [Eleginops maclovinus]
MPTPHPNGCVGQVLAHRFYCESTITVLPGIVLAVCGCVDAGLESPEPRFLQQPSATQPQRRQPGWNRSACMKDPSAFPLLELSQDFWDFRSRPRRLAPEPVSQHSWL